MDPTDKQPAQAVIPLLEDLFATELFADEVSSMSLGNGIVALTLASIRWDNALSPPAQKRVVVGRIRLPAAAAERLLRELRQFLELAATSSAPAENKKRMQ